MAGHKIDRPGGGVLRCNGQIPLVFTVLIIHDNDEFSGFEIIDSFFHAAQRHTLSFMNGR
jgi:hypothetical protein